MNHLAKTILCVVLEERIAPCGTFSCGLVGGIRDPTGCAAPNAAAACGIGDNQALSKHLCHQLCIWRLSTTLASAREFEQWLLELRAFESVCIKALTAIWNCQGIIPIGSMPLLHCLQARHHAQSSHRARVCANLATCAVIWRRLDTKMKTSKCVATCSLASIERVRCLLQFCVRKEEWPNHCMRADSTANVALDAFVHVNDRHRLSNAAFGKASLREWHATVSFDLADFELMPAHCLDLVQDVNNVGRWLFNTLLDVVGLPITIQSCPLGCIILNSAQGLNGGLHCFDILVDDSITLVLVGFLHSIL
mmetsp:Transcript_41289/g.68330  ORF Transcript_41289/g.68330 Transcript_41289/m.68330 type:complete len:308 (-) Transcript_41289:1065-1988(-)